MRALLSRIAALFRPERLDAALADEVQVHLDLLAADYERRGMSPKDARLAARKAFGGVEQMKEAHRDRRGLPFIDVVRQDVIYAVRQLRRHRGFAAAAILTLGTCLGATTAVFTIVDAVLLRPLAYPSADRLVAVHETIPGRGRLPVSDDHFNEWRRSLRSFDELSLLLGLAVQQSLTGAGEPERVSVARVSPSLLRMLEVRPQYGRLLRDDEDQPGKNRVVVLGQQIWQTRFGATPSIVGRVIELDGQPHEVVGVLPASFRFPRVSDLFAIPVNGAAPQVWTPLALAPNDFLRGYNFASIGRLVRGVSLQQAHAELSALQRALPQADSGLPPTGAELVPLHDQIVVFS